MRDRTKIGSRTPSPVCREDLSRLRQADDEIIAVLCSDLHLSHNPPILRSAEPDWYAAMQRPLEELSDVANGLPVLCAGDVFDKWNPPPELINFAIKSLPANVYAVPGQHDMPNHRYEDLGRSGYGTLVLARKITNIPPNPLVIKNGIVLFGWPWGKDISPLANYYPDKDVINLAVVHQYVWGPPSTRYKGAPKEASLHNFSKKVLGYDAVVIGDNHRGWCNLKFINCGTFMRRKSDELDYDPQIGLLHRSGKITPYLLDCSEDEYIDLGEELSLGKQTEEFLNSIYNLTEQSLDFVAALQRLITDKAVSQQARAILERAIDHARDHHHT